MSREKERKRERGRKRRRKKVARTGAELAYRWQRDKTNHRNNRRPPQPASRHEHVASHTHIYTRIHVHSYMSDVTARADMTTTEMREARYLYSYPSRPPLVSSSSLCSYLTVIDYGSTKQDRIHTFENVKMCV